MKILPTIAGIGILIAVLCGVALAQIGPSTPNSAPLVTVGIPQLAILPQLTTAQILAQFPCNSTSQGLLLGVTDASSPTYGGNLTGGSTTKTIAYCDGSGTWKTH